MNILQLSNSIKFEGTLLLQDTDHGGKYCFFKGLGKDKDVFACCLKNEEFLNKVNEILENPLNLNDDADRLNEIDVELYEDNEGSSGGYLSFIINGQMENKINIWDWRFSSFSSPFGGSLGLFSGSSIDEKITEDTVASHGAIQYFYEIVDEIREDEDDTPIEILLNSYHRLYEFSL